MAGCSSCPSCPSAVSTITLPNTNKCWNVTVNFVSTCIGLCPSSYTRNSNNGAAASFIGIDYQVDCNNKDTHLISNNCDQQTGIPSTFVSFCQAKSLNVIPYIITSDGSRILFKSYSSSSQFFPNGSRSRVFQPPTGWDGPCLLINLTQSTNQSCCQQIWNVYFQALGAGAPTTKCDTIGGNVRILACPDPICPLPCSGNTSYEIDLELVPSGGNSFIDCSNWGNTSLVKTYTLIANCSVAPAGFTSSGNLACGNIVINSGGNATPTGNIINITGNVDNTGVIRTGDGNCGIIRIRQKDPNTHCITPYTGTILFNV